MALIKLNKINKYYGHGQNTVFALRDISLSIEQGEMISIVGKSGSGKSTLLNILGGLDTPTSGDYCFQEKKINKLNQNALAEFRARNVGFIVQHFALIDDMTVFDNIALPLRYNRISGLKLRETVEHLLKQMELIDKASFFQLNYQ
ncbi:ABC transporter ATP-binding protein [Candidatus Contubernalis alkaliaceticus]|uniref:ABC transporter ATP-binding protein n=1 Tax=Candidatus Contubernalis alkaliaceticus TaxID=338645 RepID=UPI002409A147|nr:ATP-binding cassette domain-containing protein [Candidatus Contubernalis alkalaceticus]